MRFKGSFYKHFSIFQGFLVSLCVCSLVGVAFASWNMQTVSTESDSILFDVAVGDYVEEYLYVSIPRDSFALGPDGIISGNEIVSEAKISFDVSINNAVADSFGMTSDNYISFGLMLNTLPASNGFCTSDHIFDAMFGQSDETLSSIDTSGLYDTETGTLVNQGLRIEQSDGEMTSFVVSYTVGGADISNFYDTGLRFELSVLRT